MITSWSPSRLDKYESCPARAKYDIIEKLCPLCFNGKLTGYDAPKCSHCDRTPEVPPPLARGTKIHEELEMCVTGRRAKPPTGLDGIWPLVHKLRDDYKDGKVRVETDFVLGRDWSVISKFSKEAWIRTKVDVLWLKSPKEVLVIDWKTGGVDKDSGKPKADAKYADQLDVYATVVLSALPDVESVTTKLIFVDAIKDQEVAQKPLHRKDLKKHQAMWEKRTKAILSDKVFAPRPGYPCRWCPFTKNVGGPCRF